MAYVALTTIQTFNAGDILTAAALQQTNDNFEFMIDPPACSVYHSTTQATTNGVGLAILADSEFFDNDSLHSTSTNTSRITCQTAGRYELSATVEFATASAADRRISFLVNGTTSYQSMRGPAVSSTPTILTGERKIILGAGDYVECIVTQASGGAVNVTLHEFAATFRTR